MIQANAEGVFQETKAVLEVLLQTKLLDDYSEFKEMRVILADLTSDFFFVCEVLHDNQELTGSQRYCFNHRIMSNAILIAMHNSETFVVDGLDKAAILERYSEDLSASTND